MSEQGRASIAEDFVPGGPVLVHQVFHIDRRNFELGRGRVEAHDLGICSGTETGFILQRTPDIVRAPDAAFIAKERIPDGMLLLLALYVHNLHIVRSTEHIATLCFPFERDP